MVQADGWIIGALAIVGVLGSVTSLFVRRDRRMEETVGVVSKSSRIHSTVRAVTSSAPKQLVVQNTTPSTAVPKPSVELHPAVAALKAELSEARMSLGLASVAGTTPNAPSSATRFEDQKTNVPSRSIPVLQSQQSAVRGPPQSVSQVLPPTVIRPTQFSGQPQSSLGIRPPAPASPVGIPSPQPIPSPTVYAGSTPSPSVGPLPKPEQSQSGPKDVSTVITGIVPAQQSKKKEDQSPGNTQSSA